MSCAATPSRTFVADYATGLARQDEVLPQLESHFGQRFRELGKFSCMDYEGSSLFLEIKSREFSSVDFFQTIIGQNKIDFARTAGKPVIFVFVFTDGIYYIRYNAAQFSRYTVRRFRRQTRADYNDPLKEYCYIPVSDLTPLTPPRPLFRN